MSDLQYATSKHNYTDPATGQRLISVTSVCGNWDSGDKLGAGAGAAMKLRDAGLDYRVEWKAARDRGRRLHDNFDDWGHGRVTKILDIDLPWAEGMLDWVRANKPVWIEIERHVIGKGYGGRFDAYAEIDGEFWSIDAKTGKLYEGELELQLAGYNGAEGMIVYNTLGKAVSLEPLPFVTHWGALHVQAEGTQLIEVAPSPEDKAAAIEAFNNLLAVRQWHDWRRKRAA